MTTLDRLKSKIIEAEDNNTESIKLCLEDARQLAARHDALKKLVEEAVPIILYRPHEINAADAWLARAKEAVK